MTFSVLATELSKQQHDSLNTKLAPLAEQVQGGGIMAAMNLMPPKFFDYMSKQSGMPAVDLKKMMNEQAKAMIGMAEVESYDYDLSKADAQKSSSGRNYAFIPVSSKMKMGEKVMEKNGHMLALEDEGQWYFINREEQYAPIIKDIYPDMQDIKSPE